MRLDAESGLYHLRARAYSPRLGRFLQPDPIGTAGGLNLYAYVGNDPVNLVDPSGFMAERVGDAAYELIQSGINSVIGNPVEAALTVASVTPVGRAARGVTAIGRGAARSLDELSQAAGVLDRGGLTAAGRGLQNHGGREGSAFPSAKGNPSSINQQGQNVVDDILTSPGSTTVNRHHARFGDVTEVRAPDGRGVRFGPDGKFVGFLEP